MNRTFLTAKPRRPGVRSQPSCTEFSRRRGQQRDPVQPPLSGSSSATGLSIAYP